ncbi:MAG: hypothetical protein J6A41_09630 [Ruminiclostridium sp.]|nr:hypothetical protein [Ruminiclostridium sp.]
MGLFDKSEKKPERFRVKSEQYLTGMGMYYMAVVVDTETGVNYALMGGDSPSLTPLIGPDGKVVVDEIAENLGEKIY